MQLPFKLIRTEDKTGVTGTGTIAEGVITDYGAVVLVFSSSRTVNVYEDISEMMRIHGHDLCTRLEPLRGRLSWVTMPRGRSEVAWLEPLGDGSAALWVMWASDEQRYPRWRRLYAGDPAQLEVTALMGLTQSVYEGGAYDLTTATAPQDVHLFAIPKREGGEDE